MTTFKSDRRRSQSTRDETGNPMTKKTEAKRMEPVTTEELKLLRAVREFRTEEARWVAAPELFEHGMTTAAQAARWLGCSRKEMAQLMADHALPVLGGRIPRSEVLRFWEDRRNKYLDFAATKAQDLIRTKSKFWMPDFDSLTHPSGFGVEEVAARLGISKAAVCRLVSDDGPLFAWTKPRRGGGNFIVTKQELDAYARAQPKNAKRAA